MPPIGKAHEVGRPLLGVRVRERDGWEFEHPTGSEGHGDGAIELDMPSEMGFHCEWRVPNLLSLN